MNLNRIQIAISHFGMSLILICMASSAFGLTVTSLNIEWFGLGGDPSGNENDEIRDSHIRDFLTNAIPKSDVLIFQEIIDPYRIQAVFPEMTCTSYLTINKRHQHVVACADTKLRLQAEVIRDVSLGNPFLRPALKVTIQSEDGSFVDIIGVHLKAGFDSSKIRFDQLEQLKDHIEPNRNFIVMGDWNAFQSSRTGLPYDDEYYFADILKDFNIVRVDFSNHTYIYKDQKRYFDQAWSNSREIEGKVYGPCAPENTAEPYLQAAFYTQYVSDHCAIQVHIK